MSKYRIILDSKTYEIEIEKIDSDLSDSVPKRVPSVSTPAQTQAKAAPVNIASASAAVPTGGNAVISPMPGTVLKVYLSEGDTVKKGQVVLILEAMKMENEIISPRDGKIKTLHVGQGDTVQGGGLLFEIGE